MYAVDKLPQAIDIGFTGEHKFRKIQIDMSAWMEQMPNGVPSLVYIRPGEGDSDAYAVTTTFEDNILTWEITDTDLGSVEGCGVAQVWLEEAENLTLTKRGMSAKFTTRISDCVGTGTPGIPGEQTDWNAKLALKVDKSDIANNVTTTAEGKVLDARQGKALDQKIDTQAALKVNKTDVANNLTTDAEGKVLDARQGKALDDKKIDKPSGVEEGKFLQTDSNGDAVWGSPAAEATIRDAAEDWLDEHVSQGETLAVDNTLTLSGYAADSKVAGDNITALKSAFGQENGYLIKNLNAENGTDRNLFSIDNAVVGADIDVNGVLTANVNRNTSAYIPVNPGDTIYFYYLKTSVTPATSPALKATGVAAFDINGVAVPSAGTHPSSSSDRPSSYTVPIGIRYIRVSYINTNTGIMFIPNNSTLSVSETIAYTTPGYIDNYSVRFTDNQNLDDTQKRTARDNIGAIGGDIIQNLRVFDDSNMFDISAASLTSDINVNGVISYNVNRTVSDYIPVNPGDTIYFYKKNAGQTVTSELIPKNIAAYDKNKTVMPSAGQASPTGGNYTVPANVRFIRVSYVNTNTNVMFLQNNGNYPSSAEPESYKAPGYIYEGDWSSVRWMVVGDSLTANNNYAAKHYYDYVKDDTGIQIVNKGSSGDGYARDDWFYTALGTVTSSDFDVCTFFGSGNDLNVEAIWGSGATWEERFGNVADNGTETVLGYVNRAIDRFIELFPLKKLGIVTPTPWTIYSNPTTGTINGTHMDEYASALVTICKNRGIPCLDLYHESGLRPWLLSFRTEYYNDQSADHSDGVHPGTKGHKWIYPMFMQFLKQFLIN